MSNFRAIDRKTGYLLPPSVDEWLPEKHLARFIVDVIDGLDLGRMSRAYRGTGSASYHPRTLLSILVYGYATACSPAASWSGRLGILWRFAISLAANIPTITRSRRFGGAS